VKRSSKQSRIGRAGIDLIARRVGDMGHHWHPGSGDLDTGIDGEIELVDVSNDEVRNFRIGVQSKATEGIWRSETEKGFYYRAKPDDITYWLGGNQPVLLVCSRPKTNEAYFRDVHQWASDSKTRAKGLVDFDKARDRFDADAADRLFAAEARVPIVLEPPGPLPHPEVAKSNLLPIYWETPSIWSVPCPTEDWAGWFSQARDAGQARTDLVMREKRLWSLTPFEQAFLDATGVEEEPTETPLRNYTDSDDSDRLNLVGELVRKTVISIHHDQLRWSPISKVAYFKLYDNKPERKLKWGQGTGRTVVKPRPSLRHEGLSGYRHDAAELAIRRLEGQHVMSVSPTYLFTHDGRKRSSFHAEALKKMKAQDRAAAVSQQLRMWEYLLAEKGQLGADGGAFRLGHLLEVEISVRPPERAWLEAPADLIDEDDDQVDGAERGDELRLFDDPSDSL
jgi:hypothetical protein